MFTVAFALVRSGNDTAPSTAEAGRSRLGGSRGATVVEDTGSGVAYIGPDEWALLPRVPGAPWEAALASAASAGSAGGEQVAPCGRRLALGVYLNTKYHWEALMTMLVYACMAECYDVFVWVAPAWPFNATLGRSELMRAYPYCYHEYVGQVALDALLVASHTYASWGGADSAFFTAGDAHYEAWIARRPTPRTVFAVHELLPGSLDVLDWGADMRVLSIAPLGGIWALPVLHMARHFHPPLPTRLLGGVSNKKRFIVQGQADSKKRDWSTLSALLCDPAVREHDGEFEVAFLGSTEWEQLPGELLSAPNFILLEPPAAAAGQPALLSEAAFNEMLRTAHFLLPLISPRKVPMYFSTRRTSSISHALAYRTLIVAHEAVAAAYELPPRAVFTYSDDDASFRRAFVAALDMTPAEYAAARADFGPVLERLDVENIKALRRVVED